MQLIEADMSSYVNNKGQWVLVCLDEDCPTHSIIRIYATEQEAKRILLKRLPDNESIRNIQERQIRDECLNEEDNPILTREQIAERGFFINPYGSEKYNEWSNGFFSAYFVKYVPGGGD